MIFLKALVCAVIMCILGNFILSFLWGKVTFTFSGILPFLFAFISLLTLFFIQIFPFHPIWLTVPVAVQLVLMKYTNDSRGMRKRFLSDKHKQSKKFIRTLLHLNKISDGETDLKIDLDDGTKENYMDKDNFFLSKNSSKSIVSETGKDFCENGDNILDNVVSTLDIKADIRDNVNSITSNSYSDGENFHMYGGNQKNIEILFLQADIFLVQGDIEKNQQLLFYINNNYKNTSVGDRAHEELIKLYGKEVFLKER